MSHHLKTLPKCGAKTRKRKACQQVAMTNGRCYLHGGKSTGPKTKEGLLRMKQSKIKHGYYTKERINDRKEFRVKLNEVKTQLNSMLEGI